MDEERIARLLEEIRDLQRQHTDDYRTALRNQEESIRMQREAQSFAQNRLKAVPLLIIVVLVMAVLLLGLMFFSLLG